MSEDNFKKKYPSAEAMTAVTLNMGNGQTITCTLVDNKVFLSTANKVTIFGAGTTNAKPLFMYAGGTWISEDAKAFSEKETICFFDYFFLQVNQGKRKNLKMMLTTLIRPGTSCRSHRMKTKPWSSGFLLARTRFLLSCQYRFVMLRGAFGETFFFGEGVLQHFFQSVAILGCARGTNVPRACGHWSNVTVPARAIL